MSVVAVLMMSGISCGARVYLPASTMSQKKAGHVRPAFFMG